MTREEAIRIIRKMLACTDLSVRANLNADMVDACHLAIKALEQEPVIDKIRAEIEQTNKTINGFFLHEGTKKTILSIIDKYKAENNL